MTATPRIFELRQYTLHPGRRDELISLFERSFIEPQTDCGIRLDGLFTDPDRPDHFIWLRSFDDMETRAAGLEAFYGGEVWKRNRDAANATMIDSDNVLLLRGSASGGMVRGPLHCAVYLAPDATALEHLAQRFAEEIAPELESAGSRIIAVLTSEPQRNNFPQLPVLEGVFALVAIIDGSSIAEISRSGARQCFELVPTQRSSINYAHPGAPHDFDFLRGTWRVAHRRLKTRLQGSCEWERLEGRAEALSLLDGLVSTDEIGIGDRAKGTSFRHLDLHRRQWYIYWVDNRTGELRPPVRGGFAGGRGEFYGTDCEGGRPVFVRYIWSGCDGPTPTWEQAFSTDGGRNWETNWTMAFTR